MIFEIRQITFAVGLGLLSVMALAATEPATDMDTRDPGPAEAEEFPDYENWYQVEVIIFAQRNFPASDEVWPLAEPAYPDGMVSIGPVSDQDLKPHNLDQVDDLLATGIPEGALDEAPDEFLFGDRSRFSQDPMLRPTNEVTDAPGNPSVEPRPISADQLRQLFERDLPQAFRMLPADELNLAGIARSINRSSRYRLLTHLAWRQPLEEAEFPVLVQAGERYDDTFELDGTLTVSRARFLHVNTDLWLTEFAPRYDRPRFDEPEEAPVNLTREVLRQYPQLTAWAEQRNTHLPIHTHPMTQSRRMRSGTLHYLDHPFFGLVIQVSEFEFGPDEDEDAPE